MGCQWCLITAPILNFEIDTLFSLVHLLGLRVRCLSLGFVQLTDHDVVTYNHVNFESKFSLGHKWVAYQIQDKQHTKFKGEIAISCLPHLSHQGLPEGHSDLLKISIFQLAPKFKILTCAGMLMNLSFMRKPTFRFNSSVTYWRTCLKKNIVKKNVKLPWKQKTIT